MFGYEPTVNDMSGQIMGQGMASAAQIAADGRIGAAKTGVDSAQVNAQMMQDIGRDIGAALGDLAGAYQQSQMMKAGVKSGEQMLKMFGPQLGIDSKILSSPEYKAMGLMGQSQLHSNIWGSLGSLSQLRMAQTRSQQAYAAPYNRAVIDNAQDVVNQGGSGAIGATRRIPQGD